MKPAREQDNLRHLKAKEAPTSVVRIEGSTPALGRVEIAFAPRLTVLFGGNGAGKSRVLAIVAGAISASMSTGIDAPAARSTLNGFVDLQIDGAPLRVWLSGSHEARRPEVVRLEPSERDAPRDRARFVHAPSATERLRAVAIANPDPTLAKAHGFDRAELAGLRSLAGKEYLHVWTWDVESGQQGVTVPYCRVEVRDGTVYGAEDMSDGELCAFLLYEEIRTLKPNSVLLLDDPEAFLSPQAQTALVGLLVEKLVRKRATAVIATRSAAISDKVPAEWIRTLLRDHNGQLLVSEGQAAIASALAGTSASSHLAMVEDAVAAMLLDALLSEILPELRPLVTVRAANMGAEELLGSMKAVAAAVEPRKAICVLDGDMRALANPMSGILVLPGKMPPEEELMHVIDRWTPEWCKQTGSDPARVRAVLTRTHALDPHEALLAFAREMGFDVRTLIVMTVRAWVQRDTWLRPHVETFRETFQPTV